MCVCMHASVSSWFIELQQIFQQTEKGLQTYLFKWFFIAFSQILNSSSWLAACDKMFKIAISFIIIGASFCASCRKTATNLSRRVVFYFDFYLKPWCLSHYLIQYGSYSLSLCNHLKTRWLLLFDFIIPFIHTGGKPLCVPLFDNHTRSWLCC